MICWLSVSKCQLLEFLQLCYNKSFLVNTFYNSLHNILLLILSYSANPGFWYTIKFAWVQYLSIGLVIFYLAEKMRGYIYDKQIVRTIVKSTIPKSLDQWKYLLCFHLTMSNLQCGTIWPIKWWISLYYLWNLLFPIYFQSVNTYDPSKIT